MRVGPARMSRDDRGKREHAGARRATRSISNARQVHINVRVFALQATSMIIIISSQTFNHRNSNFERGASLAIT
ncbi:hypothetical protein CBOM_07745 [Ceraceosorus bombacis]|uniref:Uncharacterized protein n=1 Tax=Ceraceosorus bombacis TaxID=401625 RepID=A0A0P1BP23_9BASI|nr:hypothetical protein CBOM_07745 [Ceraceosorus bombacis]